MQIHSSTSLNSTLHQLNQIKLHKLCIVNTALTTYFVNISINNIMLTIMFVVNHRVHTDDATETLKLDISWLSLNIY